MTDTAATRVLDGDAKWTATRVAQSVLFPREGFPDALYLRDTDGWSVDPATGVLSGVAGTVLDFDTYFNAHYLAYWHKLTVIRRIGLRLSLRGRARLSVDHRTKAGSERLLDSRPLEAHGDRAVVVWLCDDRDLPGYGRLGITVGLESDCQISAIDYVTDAPPARTVRLSVGLCTFNRERYLADTLDELARLRDRVPGISNVIVVNQGEPFQSDAVHAALDRSGAREIGQSNLGGAGGFCRTIVEASSMDATHHLLMDDDIQLDGRVIANTLNLLCLLRKDVALGGSMLRAQAPTRLYEAGARLADGWHIVSLGRGAELSRAGSLARFDTVTRCDYNGWWFCVIPLEAPARLRLPLPVFVRGDDVDYGCRLGEHGIETVSFPGIAVWHDTFEAKQRPWLSYYDLRNLLINSSLHPDLVRPYRPLDLLGWIFHRLVLHQYATALALVRAADDFLSGPDHLADPSIPARHARVMTLPPIDRTERVVDQSGGATFGAAGRAMPTTVPAIAWLYVRRVVQISLAIGRRRKPVRLPDAALDPANAGPGPWARDDPDHPGGLIVYRPNILRLWAGSFRALWVAFRFLVRGRHIGRQWRARAPSLTSAAFWADQFGQSDGAVRGRGG